MTLGDRIRELAEKASLVFEAAWSSIAPIHDRGGSERRPCEGPAFEMSGPPGPDGVVTHDHRGRDAVGPLEGVAPGKLSDVRTRSRAMAKECARQSPR